MMYGYKEVRKTTAENLRNLCIKQNWFTNGTTEDYEQLLNYGFACSSEDKEITTDDLVEMATLILEYSSPESTEEYDIPSIMYALNTACYTFFCEC